jgi:hypothetical protein
VDETVPVMSDQALQPLLLSRSCHLRHRLMIIQRSGTEHAEARPGEKCRSLRRLPHFKAEGISAQAARRFHRKAAVRKLCLHPHRSMAQLVLALAAPLGRDERTRSQAGHRLSRHHRHCRLRRMVEADNSPTRDMQGLKLWHRHHRFPARLGELPWDLHVSTRYPPEFRR